MSIKLLAAAVVALVPLIAHSATPSDESMSFEMLDANKDGRISMPEASIDPKLVESFSTVDKNGDGYLDNAEFDNRTKPRK